MNLKVLVAALLAAAGSLVAGEKLPDLTITRMGKSETLVNVELLRVEADGLRVMHSAGAAKVPFNLLPPDLRAKYAPPTPAAPPTASPGTAGSIPTPELLSKQAADAASAPPGKLKETSDRFTGKMKLEFEKGFEVADGIDFGAEMNWAKESLKSPGCRVFWNRLAPAWEWKKYRPVIFLIDGVRWTGDTNILTEEFASGGIYEHLFVRMTTDDMERMTKAKLLEVRVGTREFTISDEQKQSIAGLLKAWRDKVADAVPER